MYEIESDFSRRGAQKGVRKTPIFTELQQLLQIVAQHKDMAPEKDRRAERVWLEWIDQKICATKAHKSASVLKLWIMEYSNGQKLCLMVICWLIQLIWELSA